LRLGAYGTVACSPRQTCMAFLMLGRALGARAFFLAALSWLSARRDLSCVLYLLVFV
jgi:hypothetical protein